MTSLQDLHIFSVQDFWRLYHTPQEVILPWNVTVFKGKTQRVDKEWKSKQEREFRCLPAVKDEEEKSPAHAPHDAGWFILITCQSSICEEYNISWFFCPCS